MNFGHPKVFLFVFVYIIKIKLLTDFSINFDYVKITFFEKKHIIQQKMNVNRITGKLVIIWSSQL